MMPLTGTSARRSLAIACVLLLMQVSAVRGEDGLAQLDALVADRNLEQAVKVAQQLDSQAETSGLDLTLSLARLARELEKANQLTTAADFYQRSVAAAERPAAQQLPTETRMLVRVAAAAVLAKTQRLAEAVEALRPATENELNDKHRQRAVAICLQIGAAGLSGGAAATAEEAYSLALLHANDQQRPTAMLGSAWATAIQNDRPLEAAQKLAKFIDEYPQHSDCARAVRACAECLKQADRSDDSNAMLADLLKRWPDSEAALEVVRSHQDLAIDSVPPAIGQWLMTKANANQLGLLDVETTTFGLLIASHLQEANAWAILAKHLASIDQTGQATTDLLTSLTNNGQDAEAEQFATRLISGSDGFKVAASVREAACRWAGRTMRWSMLALASEAEDPSQHDDGRTVAIERLFAESLMQTGRVEEAKKWWDSLVETRGVDDFATLLRCAEAETSVGQETAIAEQRIAAARAAAQEDRFNLALVDLVDAELSIRRTDFDQARALLENVVHSEADVSLKGRAQWLIGETHYLQQDFAKSIEAYRLVEGIDSEGIWVSAALLQAGKSFEQLGRTREATICYGNLLSRFADTSHAKLARQRMAAIAPDETPSNDSPAKQTIRR